MGCLAMCCTKSFLFVINAIFLILGLALMAAGTYGMVYYAKYDFISTGGLAALIGLGAVVCFVSGCGVCGVVGKKEKRKCFLISYGFFMILAIIAELAVGVIILLYSQEIGGLGKTSNSSAAVVIDGKLDAGMQKMSNYVDCSYNMCCSKGVNGTVADPLPCKDGNSTGKITDKICSGLKEIKFRGKNLVNCGEGGAAYQKGFYGFFSSNLGTLAALTIGFGFIQLLALIGACCIIKTKREDLEYDNDASA